jgi:hypothetical protein
MKKPKSELARAVLSYARKVAREQPPAPPTPPTPRRDRLTQERKAQIVAGLKRLHPMD